MEYNFISMLPDDQSSAKRKNYNDHLHEEITQSDFQQVIQNPPCELYLDVDNLLSSSSKSKKCEYKPPRSQNSYILYRRNESKRRKRLGLNDDLGKTSKEISEMWRKESPKIKNFFQILAAESDRRHRLKFPNYKYDPRRKSNRFKNVNNREENASQSKFVFVPQSPPHTISSTQRRHKISKHSDL
jgi:hypothetical protein